MENITVFCALVTLAFITAAISSTTGMGGIFLLAGMYALIDDIAIVLPLHACVSMISNFTRILTYFKYINRKAYGFFMIGSVPGLIAGTVILSYLFPVRQLIAPYMMVFVGLFILWCTWHKSLAQANDPPLSRFILLGTYAAPISLIFGANGAVIAPHLVRKDMPRQVVVATSTACQLSIHVLKIAIFYLFFQIKSNASPWHLLENRYFFLLVSGMIVAALLGTLFGKNFTEKISEKTFRTIFISLTYCIAAKFMLIDGLYTIFSRYMP